jgi:hypothetical protein
LLVTGVVSKYEDKKRGVIRYQIKVTDPTQ